jgi:hypothetical protein
MIVLGALGLFGIAGCHAKDAQAPKGAETNAATAKTGFESSEAVARAYASVLNEGTLEAGLALYPTDAMVEPLVACTAGPHPLKLQLETQRKQLTETFAAVQQGIHDAKLVIAYDHAAEPFTRKKGEVEGSCTLQADFETQAEILRFDPQSTMRLVVIKLSGRWYLFDAPR